MCLFAKRGAYALDGCSNNHDWYGEGARGWTPWNLKPLDPAPLKRLQSSKTCPAFVLSRGAERLLGCVVMLASPPPEASRTAAVLHCPLTRMRSTQAQPDPQRCARKAKPPKGWVAGSSAHAAPEPRLLGCQKPFVLLCCVVRGLRIACARLFSSLASAK